MNVFATTTQLVEMAAELCLLKRQQMAFHVRRAMTKAAHIRSTAATERDLRRALEPMFKRQGDAAAERLERDGRFSSPDQMLDPDQATAELVDLVLPILAVRMAEAARNELRLLGVKPRRPQRSTAVRTKQSTASEWLIDQGEDLEGLLDDMPEFVPGSMPYRIVTELPEAMKVNIVRNLRESFAQPYWRDISLTTRGDAERILERGLQNGWSTQRMAGELREKLGGDQYAKNRAFNIARTEGGAATNAARRGVMDQVAADVPEVPMKPVWLSVLGDTTRDSHANLDGVPADEQGLWNLAGYMVPYPKHFSLSAGERINCQCTILMQFGMEESEAQQLVGEHYERIQENEP